MCNLNDLYRFMTFISLSLFTIKFKTSIKINLRCSYNDYNGFAAALKEGIRTSLQNDIMLWSRKQPEKMTPGAQLRVDQFTRWMSSIVELWRYSVVNDTRKCLRKNFPGDNPALLSEVIYTY